LAVAWLGRVEYAAAVELQNALVAARLRGDAGDTLLLLEHPHVFTLGRGADERFLLKQSTIPVYRVSRGGQVTYHGPGQLIGYPILKLEATECDIIRYLRKLERTLINSLAVIAIDARWREGITGVWVGQEKIASIGVGFRRWVSLHGFALNISTDLSFFDMIVPCGIAGCRMTSIAALGPAPVTTESFAKIVQREFTTVFGYERIVTTSAARLWSLVDSPRHPCEAPR